MKITKNQQPGITTLLHKIQYLGDPHNQVLEEAKRIKQERSNREVICENDEYWCEDNYCDEHLI